MLLEKKIYQQSSKAIIHFCNLLSCVQKFLISVDCNKFEDIIIKIRQSEIVCRHSKRKKIMNMKTILSFSLKFEFQIFFDSFI